MNNKRILEDTSGGIINFPGGFIGSKEQEDKKKRGYFNPKNRLNPQELEEFYKGWDLIFEKKSLEKKMKETYEKHQVVKLVEILDLFIPGGWEKISSMEERTLFWEQLQELFREK